MICLENPDSGNGWMIAIFIKPIDFVIVHRIPIASNPIHLTVQIATKVVNDNQAEVVAQITKSFHANTILHPSSTQPENHQNEHEHNTIGPDRQSVTLPPHVQHVYNTDELQQIWSNQASPSETYMVIVMLLP